MKITQDLREEAAAMAEREKGMVEKSAEFLEKGGRLYVRGPHRCFAHGPTRVASLSPESGRILWSRPGLALVGQTWNAPRQLPHGQVLSSRL
jgi:hypothetical protein